MIMREWLDLKMFELLPIEKLVQIFGGERIYYVEDGVLKWKEV